MADRILTTHVGSLVRPEEFLAVLRAQQSDNPPTVDAYETALRKAVEGVVQKQVEAGIDIVSDGEFGKGTNWAFMFTAA